MKLRSTSARRRLLSPIKPSKSTRKKARDPHTPPPPPHPEKPCICAPATLSHVEFPLVWAEFRSKNQLCDGTVICEDGVEFKIHRAILAAVSSYFKAHFTNFLNGGYPENVTARVTAPSNIFGKVIDFAYTGHCTIDPDTVECLLRVADQYHFLGVIQLCCQYILDRLEPTNCFGVLRFARHYFCSDLEQRGRRYIQQNFPRLLKEGREFAGLDVHELLDLLQDDELNVENEEAVFRAAQRWVDVDVLRRRKHLLAILQCVRLGTLRTDFLESIVAWPPIAQNPECKMYIDQVLDTMAKMDVDGVDVLSNELFKPRIPSQILFAVGGWSAGSPTNFIETYDMRADRWLLSTDTDAVPRAYHGLCALRGLIYMVGGFNGNEHFNTVRCFDPIEHRWQERACMYYPRCYVSVVMHADRIYAMGGYNGRIRMNSVERYDPEVNQWELVKPMLKQRSDASAAVLHDKIYIVGGFNGHEVMNSGEVYDTITDQWTFIPQMLSARSGVSLVAFKDTLYALGGFNGFTRLTTTEKFVPGESTNWVDIADMFDPRSNFATVILDELVFVIGGFNGSTTINFVECYDPANNEWLHAASMNLNRSALCACVIGDLPNARDYSLVGRSKWEVGKGAANAHDEPLSE